MALSINTNVPALNAYRNLTTTQGDLSKSLERLSSGLRINRAADDAAGLAISEGLRAQINGTKQAVLNAQNGISVVQTAEGALTETHSILQRMRTLSVQAANDGGLSTSAKQNIQDEVDQLITELSRIADTTQFNGKQLLDGTYTGVFQVGANVEAQDRISVAIATSNGKGLGAEGLGVKDLNVTTVTSGDSSGEWANDVSLTNPTPGTANDPAKATLTVDSSKLTGAIAFDDGSGIVAKIDVGAVAAGWTSTTSDSDKQSSLETALSGYLASANGVDVTNGAVTINLERAGDGASFSLVAGASVSGGLPQGAIDAVKAIDNAIAEISSIRSGLGAVQNRFDHTINNLNVTAENLSASESRIRDTDMAQEMVAFTRSQILSQAGTAMLAQAKNLPQSILQLLQ